MVLASPFARSAGRIEQRIEHDVAEAIFDRRLPPGTKLPEVRLGELYGVSRTLVRKALVRLSDGGLVAMRPNCGASVAEPSVEEACEVWAARRLIEPALLEHSVPRVREDHDPRLRALLVEDHAARESGDRQRMIRASGAFHLGLARLAGNAVLARFLEQLIGRTSLVIAMYSVHVTDSCPEGAHEGLVALIEAGDIEAAKEAMVRHLRDCEDHLDLSPLRTGRDLGQMLGLEEAVS